MGVAEVDTNAQKWGHRGRHGKAGRQSGGIAPVTGARMSLSQTSTLGAPPWQSAECVVE